MPLSPNEIKLFYTNFLGLLSYVNDKYKLIQNFGHPKNPKGLPSESILTLKNKLWSNVNIIDEYIDSTRKMPKECVQILEEWKKKISKRFIIVRHLKNYSVFMDNENDLLYRVSGITDPISSVLSNVMPPVIVDAVLLPFKEVIIYDSLLQTINVQFGLNIRQSFKEKFTELKKEKGIIISIK